MPRLLSAFYMPLLVSCFFPMAVAQAQLPPEKMESTFTVSSGLELKLWAAEPLFANPTTMDIDEKGRVWICEGVNYRRHLRNQPLIRKEGDRIVILDDTDGDGKADKASTFYQAPEMFSPLGIAIVKDPTGPGRKVFYCQSPDINMLEDANGDDRADGPPKKFLTGFQGIDHDHGVHGINIGPDGKLYFSVGDTGVRNLQSADGKRKKWSSNSTDCRAGTVWRCDINGNNLELIAHNFRNDYMPAVDSFGSVFISDNDDDGNQQTRICYVMKGGNYGYHPRGPGQTHWHEEQPGVVPKILRTFFGSPTGMCVYEAGLLPKPYRGQPLHTEAGPRNLRCYHTKVQGAGFSVDQENMVSSTDGWFRPSDVRVAPDGAVFVADWYDPGVGGHGMGDHTRGRVYRIAPKGNRPSVPTVNWETSEGLIQGLSSGCMTTRYIAVQIVQSMPMEKRVQLAKQILSDPGINEKPWVAARINWFLDELPAEIEKLNREEFTWQEIRKLAVRRPGFDGLSQKEKAWVENLVKSGTPGTKREILLQLRDSKIPELKKWFYDLAAQYDGKDVFFLKAIDIAAGSEQASREELLADFSSKFSSWTPAVGDLIFELRPPAVIAQVKSLIANPMIPAGQKARLVGVIAASDKVQDGEILLDLLVKSPAPEIRTQAADALKLFLPGKWNSLAKSTAFDQAVGQLLQGGSKDQEFGLLLVTAGKSASFLQQVISLTEVKNSLETRKKALETLGNLPSQEGLLTLAMHLNSPELFADAAQALGNLGSSRGNQKPFPGAIEALAKGFEDGKRNLKSRMALAGVLVGTRVGSELLFKEKSSLPEELKSEVGRLLRNSPFQDLRNKALLAFPAPGKMDLKKLPSSQILAQKKGDASRGKELVRASANNPMQCLKCHGIQGAGGAIGPDLSLIGKKATRENLLDSLLLPGKAIADQYLTWIVENKNGQVLTGLLVAETPQFLILRDGNGKDYRVETKDIESRAKGPNSLMPADLAGFMTEQELLDMVEYLVTLQTAAFSPDWWHILGPFDNGSADSLFDKPLSPETEVNLKEALPGKNGKVSWTKIRSGANGYFDLAAHFSGASSEIISFLYQSIESSEAQEGTLLIGPDDCCKVWVNGKEVFASKEHLAAEPGKHSVKVLFKKGANSILVKINNGSGPHGLYFTLMSKEPLKIHEGK